MLLYLFCLFESNLPWYDMENLIVSYVGRHHHRALRKHEVCRTEGNVRHLLRRGAMLLSISVFALSLAACTGSKPSDSTGISTDDNVVIGISQYVEHAALDAARQGFIDHLADEGYIEGENLTIKFQNAQGDPANAQTIAQQFASDSFDLILAIATPTAQALANAISDTPILVTAVTDPADAGLVDSNEAPGTNVSGTSDLNPVDEQIDLLTRLVPDAKTVAVMYASSEPNSVLQGELALDALSSRGLTGELYTTATSNDLQSVIESSVGKVDAWYIPTDNLFASSMGIVKQVAQDANIPVIIGEKNMMDAGGLATVALDYYELGKMTAVMAIDILKNGQDPADMPIQYQEDPRIYINQDFANEIGLEIPAAILKEAAP